MGDVVALPTRRPASRRRSLASAIEAFVDAHLSAGAWEPGTAVKYRQTFTGLTTARRGQPDAPRLDPRGELADLDTNPGAARLRAVFDAAFGALAANTRARHLATLRSAVTWWRERGWLAGDPTDGWARPKVVVDTTRALTRLQVDALWRLDRVSLREKTLWRMLYSLNLIKMPSQVAAGAVGVGRGGLR